MLSFLSCSFALDIFGDADIVSVKENEYGIYRTPEGQPYDDSLLAGK